MLKKILIVSVLALITNCAFANTVYPTPIDKKGIQWISLEENMKHYPPAFRNMILDRQKQMKEKGYIERDEYPELMFLKNIRKSAADQIKNKKNSGYGDYDTYIKKDYTEIKLSFPYQSVKGIKPEDIIGYAAMGSYIKDKGWTGITAFFSSPIGICSYSRNGIISVGLDPAHVKNLVHGKPTSINVEGNQRFGFIYYITWYSDNVMSVLECLRPYNNDGREDIRLLIALANQIDI